ncbi:DUF2846 domain-containing protein [Psychrobacter sp. ANT_WB68]|uniref:DUF2846 domain-containing protein n=1 Tax=Psychrobacter sp. ANT_WB68 TaxID=2597355 RepID=UPI0011F3CFBA|nr:DUF2846 domain-containing protein [Psychrobacter sp. ANT_WB68]KAA0915203.1 DUF2846 domain-containing protein [Psychrobacter sp. ANT_WB68]
MFKKIVFLTMTSVLFAGCASVPTEQAEVSNVLKQVKAPSANNAGLYIYRSNSVVGGALKKDVWVDDECIGETARGTFFYHEVLGNMQHKVSTESEFSPNDLMIDTKAGNNYFVKQYIKPGLIVGGAGLKLVPEAEGKQAISDLNLGVKGKCSK